MYTIPQELIDLSVDFLHDDAQALIRCCLAAKACLGRARYHLFRDVQLVFNPYRSAADDTVLRNFSSLLQVRSSLPPLGAIVRNLQIDGQTVCKPYRPAIEVQHIIEIISSLPNLEYVLFKRVVLKNSSQIGIPPTLFSLATLAFCEFAAPASIQGQSELFSAFLCCFSQIRHLYIDSPNWSRHPRDVTAPVLQPSSSRPLRIEEFSIFHRWECMQVDQLPPDFRPTSNIFRKIFPFSSLRSLSISVENDSLVHLKRIAELLQECEPSLEVLTLDVVDIRWRIDPYSPDVWSIFNLPSLRKLHTLSIWPSLTLHPEHVETNIQYWSTIIDLLSSLSSCHLTSIELTVSVWPEDHFLGPAVTDDLTMLEQLQWDKIRSTLRLLVSSGLEKLVISVYLPREMREGEDMLVEENDTYVLNALRSLKVQVSVSHHFSG
ncbi:unnamed protein product [Somion occarium]|uniref:F-box domain-containing protein n=1 Tax=Somion occarium TaxID=3059160 RepID=A0ABP1DQM4_9APHY